MDTSEQKKWLETHIPHRVRAAIARLNRLENSVLRVRAFIDPVPKTAEEKVYWRCATDSIWEGRLAATRWLIEFVGIKQGKGGKYPDDVHIQDFDGGVPLNRQTLASVWKGCSQASSHPTSGNHPAVDEKHLANSLAIVLEHLQNTIYQTAGKTLRDFVLETPPA
jgi:hypothetical protein